MGNGKIEDRSQFSENDCADVACGENSAKQTKESSEKGAGSSEWSEAKNTSEDLILERFRFSE